MHDWRAELDDEVAAIGGELVAVRRHLHENPEPSREEYETTRFLANRLRDEGIPLTIPPTGRGLIAGPAAAGPVVAIRGDIDALRIDEANDVPYRSKRNGVMHACGHDAHATMVLGAALALHRLRDRWPRPVPWRAILQPAEEVGAGAEEMVAAGAVEGVRAIVALHVDPSLGLGTIGQRSGVLTASCDDVEVTVIGRGGHAARPCRAIDPIAAAVRFIGSVYLDVPRAFDSREPIVVTFGSFHAGTSNNVIPDRATIRGTIRTLDRAVSEGVKARIEAIARGVAEATEARLEVAFSDRLDPVVNDPGVTSACAAAAGEVVGPENVVPIASAGLGGEDFSAYLARVPGCMLRLGVATEGRPRQHLHSPEFDLDERALAVGVRVLARCVARLAGLG
ncbi:MAG TPA: M20 family metallopeptidase [Isosphaeraceae bacterium]|jgi:amidohydrolase|nr:M20 family metallopeptidase [Isosphaeraceae bacterium]